MNVKKYKKLPEQEFCLFFKISEIRYPKVFAEWKDKYNVIVKVFSLADLFEP